MNLLRRNLLRTVSLACGSWLLPGRSLQVVAAETASSPVATPAGEREKVSGIGGFFFRAHDPKGLARWYQEHLGISLSPQSMTDVPWRQEAGTTIFTTFTETSSYFETTKPWMLNFRVRDLDKMTAQLRAAGIAVNVDPQSYPNGRFARIHDPEGNPIELWQPMPAGA